MVIKLLENKQIPFIYLGNTNNSVFAVVPRDHSDRAEEMFFRHLVKHRK